MEVVSDVKRRVVPWVEKYRPETVDEVSHQAEVTRALASAIQQGNIPHLMFYGPPGTGKTTTILAVARALYGPELYKTRILDLNASDERGIAVVREKIKTFAQGAVGSHKTPGYPCPRYKLIILDEADTMTAEAQSALRRIMEAYSRVTRFCLICNYVTRIIEPLASRCAKFRFKPLSVESMVARMNYIATSESVSLGPGALDTIMAVAEGDMRKAVTFLQSAHQLAGSSPVSVALIDDLTSQIPKGSMQSLWTAIGSGSFDVLSEAVKAIVYEGYPMSSILPRLLEDVVYHDTFPDVDKALISEKLARCEESLIDGSNEAIQLLDVTSFIMRRKIGLNLAVDSLASH